MLLRRHRKAREGRQTTSAQTAPEAVDDAKPYGKRTNDELRAELEARGLDTDGKKAELVARLEAADAEGEGSDLHEGAPEGEDPAETDPEPEGEDGGES